MNTVLLIFFRILALSRTVNCVDGDRTALTLFFKIVIVMHSFRPAGVFSFLTARVIIVTQKRKGQLLLKVITVATPVYTMLPGTAAMVLLTPLLPAVTRRVGIGIIPLLVLVIFITGDTKLVALIKSPTAFVINSTVGVDFTSCLIGLDFNKIVTVTIVVTLLPVLFSDV